MKSITTIFKNLSIRTRKTLGAIPLGMPLVSMIIATLLSAVTIVNTSLAGSVHGYVYTRNVITNEAGNRIWALYNPQTGAYEGEVGEAAVERDPSEWRVMSGEEHRGYVAQKETLHEAQPDLVLISRAEFEAGILLADSNPMTSAAGLLSSSTAYASILPQERRLTDDATGLILAEYPINPDIPLADDIFSMLHKFSGADIGQIKDTTPYRIGFKVAFAKDSAGNPVPIEEGVIISGSNEYEAVGPIANARLEGMQFSQAVSQDNGAFSLFWPSIPCPGFSYSIDSILMLELHYQRFNPKANGSPGLYLDTYPTSESCYSSFFFIPLLGPYPTGWTINTYPTRPIQFAIDLTVLSGTAQLSKTVSTTANRVQLSGNKVPIGAVTQYQAETPDNTKTITTGYDFDRDGTNDTILDGHFETDVDGVKHFMTTDPLDVQGVWLSSSGHTPQDSLPGITRLMDSASFSNYTHQGLLAEISAEDLRNTDIYVVRVSDGKLISERIGLNEYEADRISKFGEDADNSQFFYTIQMQGSTGDKRFYYNEFSDWQAASGINPDLHQRQADHLQPGDAIRIYAINRATGYIGHVDSVMQAGTLANGDLSFHIDPIVMGPPNLKVRAERGYIIDKGASASTDIITQLIGFEGASLTSDTAVTITTEWLDHEGRPLPASLEGAGYTGRIAILSGDNNNSYLPANSEGQGVYSFSIDPGRRLQVLQLPNELTGSEHFYIHVSGEPKSGNPIFAGSTDNQRLREADFSSSGQNPGILSKRPDNYVPFLTPIFDEAATELQSQAYRELKRNNPNQTFEAPEPLYKWVYRPEMQFTSYDLTVSEINRSRDADASGTIEEDETVNINNDDLPLISSDSVIEILYGLSTTDLLPLEYFNAGDSKELVFVIGEQEVTATLGADQRITFDDLSHLALLNPDDLLSIRLYANNDMGNVLREFAFGLLPLTWPNDIAISADDSSLEIGISLPGATGIGENGQPKKVIVDWSVEGVAGTLATASEESTSGVFTNTLYYSYLHNAGDEYTVTARILESDDDKYASGTEVKLGPYTVVPGAPDHIELSWPTSNLPADGTSQIEFNARIYDVYENPVADGTQVSWKIADDADIDIVATDTSDGQIAGTIKSGVVAGTFDVELYASNNATSTAQITTNPLSLAVNASATQITAGSDETITITASAPNAADGTPVEWISTLGVLDGDDALNGGTATVVLSAAERPGQGTVIANVGGEKAIINVTHEGTGIYAELEDAAIVGGESADGFVDIEQWDGSPQSYAYKTHTNLIVNGTPNEQINFALGSPNQPNSEPVAYFPLMAIESGYTDSADGQYQGMILGQVTSTGNSLRIEGGHILLEDAAQFHITDNIFVNLDFVSMDGAEATLVSQGAGDNTAYALNLVQVNGETFVQANIVTTSGAYSLTHTQPITSNTKYKVGFRYLGGLLELQVENGTRGEIQSLSASGQLLNTTERITIGQGLNGTLANFRIGVEGINALLAFDNGDVSAQITLDASGTASIPIASNGLFTGTTQQVGLTFSQGGATPQPVQLVQNDVADAFLEFFIKEAGAATRAEVRARHRNGVTVTKKETSGWFQSFVEKVSAIADTAVEVAKVAGQIASVLTGLDDFIVLTKALMALAAGARDQINLVDVTFAAVGAILTIATIVTAGVSAAFIVPLKQALGAFKIAIKALRPSELRAAFGMAKGLGALFKEIVTNFPGNLQVAKQLVYDLGSAVAHLAQNLGNQIFQIFLVTIRSPLDFVNWVKSFKMFNKTCLASNDTDILFAQGMTPKSIGKWLGAGALAFFISSANAATPCEAAMEAAYRTAFETFQNVSAIERAEKMSEFNKTMAEIENYIKGPRPPAGIGDGFDALQLGGEAAMGMAKLLEHGRNSTNIRSAMRDIVREVGVGVPITNPAEVNRLINKYFSMVANLDSLPVATVGNRLWGDLGKYIGNSGFLRGSFHQLEVMTELRAAGIPIESLEEGFSFSKQIDDIEKNIWRYIDIKAGGRHFEVKNFKNYGPDRVKDVTKGLDKEIGRILDEVSRGVPNPSANDYLAKLDQIHIVFRGSPVGNADQIVTMLKEMRKTGIAQLKSVPPEVRQQVLGKFNSQIDTAINAAQNGATKIVPDLGDLVVFQGKTVPY